ncbi:MAG TPA: hypothetical protein VGB98_13580 [Pyrinomonadaceae bacterium]|jgi:hypothetical protein
MNTNKSDARPPRIGRRPSAAGLVSSAALLLLLLSSAAAAQSQSPQTRLAEDATRQLRAQVEEYSRAFMDGKYERMADLMYPKAVEMAGGREKMIEIVRNGMDEMKTQGYEALSYAPAAEPTQVLREGRQLYVVLPTKLRMNTPDGIQVAESFMIGISADDGKNWRLFGSGSLDAKVLKLLLPEVADKLKLPTFRIFPEVEKKPEPEKKP